MIYTEFSYAHVQICTVIHGDYELVETPHIVWWGQQLVLHIGASISIHYPHGSCYERMSWLAERKTVK